MKKFLLRLLVYSAIIFAIDIAAGKAFSYMHAHAKGGDNGRNNYICNDVDADILIFGSSRAMHHYNPILISDSLGMSCYNCGQDGNGAILNYARFQLICQRYNPKLIIYDVTPEYDLLSGDDNHKYLGWLRAYYDMSGIADIFESIDSTEKYKMLSQLYRYNTKFIQIVSDYIYPIQDEGILGYRPIKGVIDPMRISKKDPIKYFKSDSLKLLYFRKFLELSKNSKTVFVVSPYWHGKDSVFFKPIQNECVTNGYEFINYANNSKYHHNMLYFKDRNHLNSKGADEFTKDVISQLKMIICANK